MERLLVQAFWCRWVAAGVVPAPGGGLQWLLSEQPGCNDILAPDAAEQNCSIPSECYKAAVTVILPEFY